MSLPDDPDAWARLFYLVLLLLGMLGFFASGAGPWLGALLRQVLIWVLIFAMAILAYAFRDTLRGALFPGAAVEVSTGVTELRRAADGHFHATLEVEGTPVRFIVDTGASEIVLSHADAERVGVDLAGLAYTGRALTANGPVATARIRLGEVAFGGVVERGVPASVTEGGGLDASLLGMSYLDRFARIEIEGDRMRLSR